MSERISRLIALYALAATLAGGLALASPASAQSGPQSGPMPAAATSQAPLDAAERKLTIEDLAAKLEANFVFPDVAKRYAAMLRTNLANGAYDGVTDPKAFGEKVTADLQAVAKDGHLRLKPLEDWGPPPSAAGGGGHALAPRGGLEETRMIGDVAYLRFSGFPDDAAQIAKARGFLLEHATAKAVVIDSRANHGGFPSVMDAILPLLYAKPTVLLRMDARADAATGGPNPAGPTLERAPSPPELVRFDEHVTPDAKERRLQHVPVYYLTSHITASAAEALALAFKRTHRAVLVGETTNGANHFGSPAPIGKRFAAFIPFGRTYDPDTNWDWEGKGVAPDVTIPADQALAKALELARAAGAHPG
jgi:hypothetical protein